MTGKNCDGAFRPATVCFAMETITSRKNSYIRHLRRLAADGDYRRGCGEYVCDGDKLLGEALRFARVTSILWRETPGEAPCGAQYTAPAELFEYASPLKSSGGPVFTVALPAPGETPIRRAIVLEGVQDPGNVGAVIRTANAFGVDAVVLTGECADLYHPRTVRATMGAIFRQNVLECAELDAFLRDTGLPLYGAALSDRARDIREVDLKNAAVAIGSEGRGLSQALLARCDGTIIIPMRPDSESLNAAAAAAVCLWEMAR